MQRNDMVGGKRRRSQRRDVLGSHQKCWLFGRHAVLETLRAGGWRPLEVWLADDLEAEFRDEAAQLAAGLSIPVEMRTAGELTRRCGGLAHQGLMAKMPPFPYADPDAVIEAGGAAPLFLVLDGIQDPFNFGAILRSAEVFGVQGVFVPSANQSEVTVQVARSSAGAVNHLPIAQAADLAGLLETLRSGGVKCVAATGAARQALGDCDLTGPCAVVIGNEGTGVRREVVAACDEQVRIPQAGRVESLNAAVAAGILCYEVQRQRGAGDRK
jgi:23S rRNA (guanosine2251-2'-O)-methyltransferase